MGRGQKKHLKRLCAPKSWMLAKLGGVFAVKPRQGPHNSKECLPIACFLRNRLKYALTLQEVKYILKNRDVKIDGRVRTDHKYPTGFMDVVEIEKTGENFRIIYDVKGRFTVHRITATEAKYKLCKVREKTTGKKAVPYVYTTDGRTIRYPDPIIKIADTIQLDLTTGKVQDVIPFEIGNLCMITGGRNTGRVGTVVSKEKHPGSFDIIHVKDANGNTFATRQSYVFIIGKGSKPFVSLPRGKGIKLTISEERDKRLGITK